MTWCAGGAAGGGGRQSEVAAVDLEPPPPPAAAAAGPTLLILRSSAIAAVGTAVAGSRAAGAACSAAAAAASAGAYSRDRVAAAMPPRCSRRLTAGASEWLLRHRVDCRAAAGRERSMVPRPEAAGGAWSWLGGCGGSASGLSAAARLLQRRAREAVHHSGDGWTVHVPSACGALWGAGNRQDGSAVPAELFCSCFARSLHCLPFEVRVLPRCCKATARRRHGEKPLARPLARRPV
jgi:hypothetical protein